MKRDIALLVVVLRLLGILCFVVYALTNNMGYVGEIVLKKLKMISPGAFLGFLTNFKNIKNERQMRKHLKKYL